MLKFQFSIILRYKYGISHYIEPLRTRLTFFFISDMVYNGLLENCKKKLMLHFIIISNKKVILQRKHKQQNMHNTLFLRRHLNVMDVR